MEASALMQVLHQLPVGSDKDMLVGLGASDDAAVYRLTDKLAMVTSVDFFPPVVDDARQFGEVSAANALSDIYAMGATPRYATSIACFPKELPLEILREITEGCISKLHEAGAVLAGGHTIEDKELKFGLAVNGTIDPAAIVTNAGAKPGDVLVLTKPLGVGVIASAVRANKATIEAEAEANASMKRLNRAASKAMVEVGVNACTDVTGFGLLGHAFELASASDVSLEVCSLDVPFFDSALRLVAKKKFRPRAISTNREFIGDKLSVAEDVDEARLLLMLDPQTSGGLLMAVDEAKADALLSALRSEGEQGHLIGKVIEGPGQVVKVV